MPPATDDVLVLPTAAAYEHPERAVATAEAWFEALGAHRAAACPCSPGTDALDEATPRPCAAARFIYLARRLADAPALGAQGLAGLGARSRRRGTTAPWWPARPPAPWCCATRWSTPAAAPSRSASAWSQQLAVIPHHETWSEDKEHRTLDLAPATLPVAGIDERTALLRAGDGDVDAPKAPATSRSAAPASSSASTPCRDATGPLSTENAYDCPSADAKCARGEVQARPTV